MLNLNELEKRLDEALEKETTETLTSWLMSKRFHNYIMDNGDGEFDILLSKSSRLSNNKNSNSNIPCQPSNVDDSYKYSEAA